LNLQVKELGFEAGWNDPVPKLRQRRGKMVEVKRADGQSHCFSSQVTAHTMRRTAITTLLILGVPELVVRRLSGHAPGSKEFYKYVVIAQDYANKEVMAAFDYIGKKDQPNKAKN
jgi:integrase